jgi:hypothetical protein
MLRTTGWFPESNTSRFLVEWASYGAGAAVGALHVFPARAPELAAQLARRHHIGGPRLVEVAGAIAPNWTEETSPKAQWPAW